jgi:SWI/SNF-related matrix-associated actin-dependent regulator 1 of chromatin subfamily A
MKPFQYQLECLNAIDSFNGRSLVSCSMGLGKTAISLWWADRHETLPMVVVCPAALKWQWQAEVGKVLGEHAYVCEGRKAEHFVDHNFVIINYEILGPWLKSLQKLKPELIVLDECQYIMNPTAQRTKNVRKLCKKKKYILALSGTPLLNRPIELFPTINLLYPIYFPSRFKFGMKYCAGKHNGFGYEFKGASKPKELHRILTNTCMIRKKKSEVLKDLPDKIRQVTPIELSSYTEYRKAERDFIGWLREKDEKAAERAMRATALTKIGHLLRLSAEHKVKSVIEWINEWLTSTDEKMIVFATHRNMISALAENVKSNAVIVDGSIVGKKRQRAVDSFQSDASVRVLFGNIKAAGAGLNLTAASHVVFAELPWHPGAVLQAEDRAHRIGQKRCVNIHYLVAHHTIEEKRCSVITKKQRVLEAVLDGNQDENELDVFDEFLEGFKL